MKNNPNDFSTPNKGETLLGVFVYWIQRVTWDGKGQMYPSQATRKTWSDRARKADTIGNIFMGALFIFVMWTYISGRAKP